MNLDDALETGKDYGNANVQAKTKCDVVDKDTQPSTGNEVSSALVDVNTTQGTAKAAKEATEQVEEKLEDLGPPGALSDDALFDAILANPDLFP